jgi:hypothetical protein
VKAALDVDWDDPAARQRALEVVLAAVDAVAVLVGAWLTGRLHLGWWGCLGCSAWWARGCGYGWRIMTAAVSGANIGGGLVLIFGGPIGLGLVGVALWGA